MIDANQIADFVKKNETTILKLLKKGYASVEESLMIKTKKAYTNYLENTAEKYSKSKSFFIGDQPVNLYDYYVPIGISCGQKILQNPGIKNCSDCSKRIVITGSGGSGKTVLMKHLFLNCIKVKPYVPVFIELRDLNTGESDLSKLIKDTLDSFEFKVTGKYIEKAKAAGHFAFFLDGYDEVHHALRKNLVKQIQSLSTSAKQGPIFISSRPDDDFNGLNDFSKFKILPLTLKSASELIEKLPFDEQIKTEFIYNLEADLFEKHESFLSNPLLLSIMLLTYGQNAEIPTKLSIFYDQAYQALFHRHDAKKGGFKRKRLTNLDIQDFSRVFSIFCLHTYHSRSFSMPRRECLNYLGKCKNQFHFDFKIEDYLNDLLSATCLLVEEGMDIAFSHRSFQEYFVAIYISQAPPDIQKKLIELYWKNAWSDQVIKLLLEINPEIVERLLLLPKLKNIFSKIKVKKKIGVTHLTRYFKAEFEELSFQKDGLWQFYIANTSSNYALIIRLTVDHMGTYQFLKTTEQKKKYQTLYNKYVKEKKDLSYKTKDITPRSPVMSDIIKLSGTTSMEYLQAAFDAFQILKKQNKNRATDLDDLLGNGEQKLI